MSEAQPPTTQPIAQPIAHQGTCVMIGTQGLLIEGPPGSGKSSLALALIDRGATLVGDDGVLIEARNGRVIASPHPRIAGKLEIRNLGLVEMPAVGGVPLALVVRLDAAAPRFVAAADSAVLAGCALPMIRLYPDTPVLALRAEVALRQFGLPDF